MEDEENATYVEHSGLAVVHEGEKIVAAAGSEAVLTTRSGGETHYHFPIHVVVVGDIGEDARSEIVARVWDELHAALS
jgi:hypothetical protein